ncbi:putative serine/threonine-protein kinase iks1 [Thecaphora frezii]
MQSRLSLSHSHAHSGALARVRRPRQHLPLPPYVGDSNDLPDVISDGDDSLVPRNALCPSCLRPWSLSPSPDADTGETRLDAESPAYIAPNYFRLLAQANSVPGSAAQTRSSTPVAGHRRFDRIFAESQESSRCATPDPDGRTSSTIRGEPRGAGSNSQPLQQGSEAEGYYARFFVEIKKLGRGARGTVFLCQHVLNGNKLGRYAIKKIPVGDHAESLLKSLNEVHLMESLHHPHLIHYQHAWIESCQLSAFAPRVPTLHVLMMAANGGSLADWISARSGEAADQSPHPSGTESPSLSGGAPSAGRARAAASAEQAPPSPTRAKLERLKAALRQRRAQRNAEPAPADGRMSYTDPFDRATRTGVGVHLLRDDEIYSLMHDMASGLGFLHDRGILHLDIKPGNVLLHWDEDALIPRAMLSDFGSSMLLHDNWTRQRSGHTGTMEYMSPETLTTDPVTGKLSELSSKADIWSLGMILHLLLYFHLPYSQVDDVDRLRDEMLAYRGFSRSSIEPAGAAIRRQRPAKLVQLLERLLDLNPARRPSCKDILQALASGPEPSQEPPSAELLAVSRRPPYPNAWSTASTTTMTDDDVAHVDAVLGAAPVSQLPKRISLNPDSIHEGRGAVGNRSSLGDKIADAIWIRTAMQVDPTFVRIVLAIATCFGKCLWLDLHCLQRGQRPTLWVWYLWFALGLSEVAVASLAKPYRVDLTILCTLTAVQLGVAWTPATDTCLSL